MTVDWHGAVSHKPPLYSVALVPERFTYHLIRESGEFGLNFISFEKAQLVAWIGGTSGQIMNKFEEFKLAREFPEATEVPLLADAYVSYECRLVDTRPCGDRHLIVGEVLAVHWEEGVLVGEMLDMEKVRPVLYLGGETYLTVSPNTTRELDHHYRG
jgi:flavin reductase (DIM6/NTAB) family NADH-FMN oxidoreductase RutF